MAKKKLVLKKETISHLSNVNLERVRGGAPETCGCPSYEEGSCWIGTAPDTLCILCGWVICETDYKPG